MSLTWASGDTITAARLNNSNPLSVIKASTENVNSSTTLQNDDELFLDLAAGRVYRVEAVLLIPTSTSTVPNIKLAWSTTGTITQVGARTSVGPALGTTDNSACSVRSTAHGLTTAVAYGVPSSGNTGSIRETMLVSCTAAGRLQLQWAQNTSNAATISVQSLSYITATPIS